MRLRLVGLFALAVLLSGFTPCLSAVTNDPVRGLASFGSAQLEANRRADALQQECDAVKARPIPFEEEHSLGGAVSLGWVSRGGGLTGAADRQALHAQLNRIGKNLAAQSERPHLPWTFGVLASPGVNAVSGPGGYVFVSEGLLSRLENEAQLAGVLAHEIAHVTGRHALEEYRQLLVDQCELGVKAERMSAVQDEVAAGLRQEAERRVGALMQGLPGGELRSLFRAMASGPGGFDFDRAGREFIRQVTDAVLKRLAEKGFRQEDEHAADAAALELMAAAGYAPDEYIRFLAQVPQKGLSTAHPRAEERQERLGAHLTALRQAAAGEDFTPVDPAHTRVVPLRDALRARRAAPTVHEVP